MCEEHYKSSGADQFYYISLFWISVKFRYTRFYNSTISGFTVTSESLFFEDNDVNYNQKSVDCSESKWKPSGRLYILNVLT